MVRIRLQQQIANRLAAFLRRGHGANRSDHWTRYDSLNRIRVEGEWVIVEAGPGFDSEYELNFRSPRLRERAAWLWHRVTGKHDLKRYQSAYRKLWSEDLLRLHSPHQVIAHDYMRRMPFKNVSNYLEIGAGTGYLAALAHERWGARVTIIDLLEILPLGFLFLHARFPGASVRFPHESGQATFTFLTSAEQVPDNSVDLAVNTASFGEMRPEQIAYYFRELRRAVTPAGCLFTVNREEKWMDGAPIRFAEYPWSSADVDLSYGPSPLYALTQPENRMLVRICRLAKQV